MLYYSSTPDSFTYQETIMSTLSHANITSKEYFCKRGVAMQLPYALKWLMFYTISENVLMYIPRTESIKRSTTLEYYFNHLKNETISLEEARERNSNYVFGTNPVNFGITEPEDIFTIRIIPVAGQIQTVFEKSIIEWAHECGATEVLNVSLALKLTPRHRIRVYKRNEHIIVFTTKGINDELDVDAELKRKLWACIPLLRGWTETPELKEKYATLIELHMSLANKDATHFWTLLEAAYNNSPTIKDLKYSGIIQTFNGIKEIRISVYKTKLLEAQRRAESLAQDYAKTLSLKRDAERNILEIQQTELGLDVAAIKRLVDKKICYGLNISTNNDGILSYRCTAPLLSYDKDAAYVCYNKRVKGNYTEDLEFLFKLLFIDEKAVLNFDEPIDISLTQGTIQSRSGYTRLNHDYAKWLPNPHHFHYNCWGSYQTVITKLIHEYKLEELFYQIKAAIGSLNFLDYPVLDRFLNDLSYIVSGRFSPNCFYWRDENCTTLHTFKETKEHFAQEVTE